MTTHKKWRGEVRAAALAEGAVAVAFEVTRGQHQFAHITFPGNKVGRITISLSPSDGNAIKPWGEKTFSLACKQKGLTREDKRYRTRMWLDVALQNVPDDPQPPDYGSRYGR
jgi:outer membrane protein assembly factor BamA